MSRAGGTLPHGGPGGEKHEISKRFDIENRVCLIDEIFD